MYCVPGFLSADKVTIMQEKLLAIAPKVIEEFPEARIVLELQGWNVIPTITIFQG